MTDCPTGKTPYTSARAAKSGTRILKAREGHGHAYRCPTCHAWHVSSQGGFVDLSRK